MSISVSLSVSLSSSAPLCGSLAFCVIRMFFHSDFYTNRHIGLHTCRSLLSLLTVILYACILENGYPNRMRYSHRYRDKCIIIIVVIIIDDNYNNIIMTPVIICDGCEWMTAPLSYLVILSFFRLWLCSHNFVFLCFCCCRILCMRNILCDSFRMSVLPHHIHA